MPLIAKLLVATQSIATRKSSKATLTLQLSTVIFTLCFLAIGCTEVPLGSAKITSGKREVSGTVRLEQSSEFKNIYIWLEGFKISTITDNAGNFSLTLPPPSSQNAGGGVSGLFNLYFYLANYFLATSEVVVHNGEFLYSKADLDKDGELLRPKILTEFLRIATDVSPNVTNTICDTTEATPEVPLCDNISVSVTLQANRVDSVLVVFPRSEKQGRLGAFLLKEINTGKVFIITADSDSNARGIQIVKETPVSWQLSFTLRDNPVPKGTYEVIPYLLIRHQPVPSELIFSLGDNVEALSASYLKIPFRRKQAFLEIL